MQVFDESDRLLSFIHDDFFTDTLVHSHINIFHIRRFSPATRTRYLTYPCVLLYTILLYLQLRPVLSNRLQGSCLGVEVTRCLCVPHVKPFLFSQWFHHGERRSLLKSRSRDVSKKHCMVGCADPTKFGFFVETGEP